MHTKTPLNALKGIGFFLLFGLMVSITLAQDLSVHIPKEATTVLSFSGQQLFAKVDPQRILDMPMVREITERPGFDYPILGQPEEHGVNLYRDFHFFQYANEEIQGMAMLIPLKNAEAFGNFAATQWEDAERKEADGFQYQQDGNKLIGWNNQLAIIINGSLSMNNPQIYELEWEERAQLEAGSLLKQTQTLFSQDTWNSINGIAAYQAEKKKKGDLLFWTNAGAQLNPYNTPYMQYSPIGGIFNQLESFYKDNFTAVTLNFEPGMIQVEAQNHYNPRIKELVEETNDTRLNRDLFRYIQEDGLMAYMSFAFNSRKLWDGMQDLLRPMLDSIPNVSGGFYSSAIEVLDIFIDEDEIYQLLPGNGMLVLSGINSFETTYTTYEYDDDFNAQEITKTKEEKLPEFTFMLSTDGEENMRKIMDLLVKLPDGVVSREGTHYLFPLVQEETGFPLYLSIADGIVFLSNDEDLIQNRLGTGYPNSLGKKHVKALKKNNQVIYWNTQKTLADIPLDMLEDNEGFSQMMLSGAETFDEMWVLSSNRKDPSRATMQFSFQDGNQNALDQFIDWMNEAYLAAKNR
jgi:hypothetical protein